MLSQVVRESARSAVEIEIDASLPRLFVRLGHAATGGGFAAALSRLYSEQPQTAYYDKLYDLTEYSGTVTPADVLVIREAYVAANTDPHHPCRTAFVTNDPNFRLWAAAMSHQFLGREHRAFATFEAARAFLDEPIGDRPPFVAE